MYQSAYYVAKSTGTFTDALLAIGLARLIEVVLPEGSGPKIWIRDIGSHYSVECPVPVSESRVASLAGLDLLPYIRERVGERLPENRMVGWRLDLIDLPAERAKLKERQDTLKKLKAEKKDDADIRQAVAALAVDERLSLASALQSLKALTSYRKIVLYLLENPAAAPAIARGALRLFGGPSNDFESSATELRRELRKAGLPDGPAANALQVVNPDKGKGASSSSPGDVTVKNVPSHWLLEYLKFIGLFEGGLGKVFKVGARAYDKKVYVLAPVALQLGMLAATIRDFRQAALAATPVAMDIGAVLNAAIALVNHWPRQVDETDPLARYEVVADCVSGLHAAYFKSMGQADSVSNLSFMGLPKWVPAPGPKWSAERILTILGDQHKSIGAIAEDGDTLDLLSAYRDFVSSGRLQSLFRFFSGFAALLMHELSQEFVRRRHRYIRPFPSDTQKEVIVMTEPRFAEVVNAGGFNAIADAIRNSTVNLQYADKSKRMYEVKYGLAQKVKERATYRAKFLAFIGEFAAEYNQENLRVYERLRNRGEEVKQRRKNITDQDLKELTYLVDRFGSEVVANLLIGIGYSSRAKTPEQEKEEAEEAEA